jgi:hypothetical protein
MTMKKLARKSAKSLSRTGTAKRSVRKSRKSFSIGLTSTGRKRSDVLGRTRDGVFILRPKVKSKHFTSRQIRQAIIEVENASSD